MRKLGIKASSRGIAMKGRYSTIIKKQVKYADQEKEEMHVGHT